MNPFDGAQCVLANTVASTGAEEITLNIRPAQGEVWVVQYAITWHVSGAARNTWWTMTDIAGTQILTAQVSRNDYAYLPWDGGSNSVRGMGTGDLVLTYDRYLTARLTATGAGDDLYVRAVYRKFVGAS